MPAFGATRAGTRDGQVVLWLAAAGGLMLLAACLNVAVLLSIQVLDRAGEFAVRRQLGATRARVFAQFLLEHLAAAAVCGVPASQASSYVDDAAPRTLLVRSRGPARAAVGPVAAALRGTDPDLPFIQVRLLADLVDDQTRSWRLGAAVFGLLGGFAAALAAVGGFAVLALSVRSRAREIGIRMALGARRGNVVAAVLRRGLGVVVAGLVVGGAVSATAYRLMDSLLVGVTPADPASFAAAVLVVFTAGAAAGVPPAVRAARLDPAEGVRQRSA